MAYSTETINNTNVVQMLDENGKTYYAISPALTNSGRIMYVDPNDVNGSINGVPMTPDYTKFCISFDLIVEKVSRFDPYNPLNENLAKKDTAMISWQTTMDNIPNKDSQMVSDLINKKISTVSFLQGRSFGGHDFLSTYYADAHYNEIKNEQNKVVEGLGVESVQISFENWFAPVATIKFVDVRGVGLFGVEEARHDSYKGEITADTVFGCFFTFPYPKFRLQVKGFYGQAVTYQLSCKSFKGGLNAQTGNYEATVSFIGYEYGLLTDIPMSYLLIAPEISNENWGGKEYWDNKTDVSDPSSADETWKLSNGKYPPRLRELIQRINAAIDSGEF